jgi:hypothetical protein
MNENRSVSFSALTICQSVFVLPGKDGLLKLAAPNLAN